MQYMITVWILCITMLHALQYGSWRTGGALCTDNKRMAVGYDAKNDTILLLGGQYKLNYLVLFHLQSRTCTKYTDYLPVAVQGQSQYYTQLDNILWMIDFNQNVNTPKTFNIFNVETRQFIPNYKSITIPDSYREQGCLASTTDDNDNQYLIVVGVGWTADLVQIFNVSSDEWLSNVPRAIIPRLYFSCIVNGNQLYAIGGYHDQERRYVTSIESLDVSALQSGRNEFDTQWSLVKGNLSHWNSNTVERTSAVNYGSDILITGAEFHILDTTSNTVSQGGELVYATWNSAAIIVEQTAYVFQGQTPTGDTASWQYLGLPSLPTYNLSSQSIEITTSDSTAETSSTATPLTTAQSSESTTPPSTAAPSAASSSNSTLSTTAQPTTPPSTTLPSTATPSSATLSSTTPSVSLSTLLTQASWVYVSIIVFVAIIVVYCFIFCLLYRRKSAEIRDGRHSKSVLIRNPLCVLLAIGDYDAQPPSERDLDATVMDLNVDIDIHNLVHLFQNTLHYEVVPKYDAHPKLYWTQHDIIRLLQEQAQIFADHVISNPKKEEKEKRNYDGLIVVMSGHGMDNKLVTSDYKLIDKNVIHRIFSSYHPASREVPRIVMYDCCDGYEERKGINGKQTHLTMEAYTIRDIAVPHAYTESGSDTGKSYEIQDICAPASMEPSSSVPALWQRYTKNPDHKLATIHAANLGFQSKMNLKDGSYLIHKFVHKTLEGLDQKVEKQPFLYEIFDDIQQELGETKQLPTFTFNHNTRFIKFVHNKDPKEMEVELVVKANDEIQVS